MKWLRRVTLIAVILSSASWLGSKVERIVRRVAHSYGAVGDFRDVTAEQLERDVRSNLPAGTSRAAAEKFLKQKGIRYTFDPDAQAVVANASYIKGNPLGYSSLRFTIHLDERSNVASVESKGRYIGP